MNRQKDFNAIKRSLRSITDATGDMWASYLGDSLEILKKIPSHSVSLILTDPPYHVTKKRNIAGDTSFKENSHFIEWMDAFAKEWVRILRPTGSLFCFCAPKMAAYLEVSFAKQFNILSHVVWTKPNDPGFDGWKQKMKKESLRGWYDHSERVLFAEPAFEGNLRRSYFGKILREKRHQAGMSGHELTELTGAYGKVNHGGAISNWEAGRNVPSREQYARICDSLTETGKVDSMPAYEDIIRPFKMDGTKEFTDVWSFPSVRPYKGKHPAEKPLALLEHAIEATTYPEDIVLDCFSGSGNTALAATQLGRYAIAIDIETMWFERTNQRLESEVIEPHKGEEKLPLSNTSARQEQLALDQSS